MRRTRRFKDCRITQPSRNIDAYVIRLAFEHLRDSLTKGNLWIYILPELEKEVSTPAELKRRVQAEHGFSPAAITFYSVVYKLQKEGLVRRSSSAFRSTYMLTDRGAGELQGPENCCRKSRRD